MKEKLEELARERFYLNMKDHWSQEDFKKDDELLNEIEIIIEQFLTRGVEVDYQLGYPIKYKEIK